MVVCLYEVVVQLNLLAVFELSKLSIFDRRFANTDDLQPQTCKHTDSNRGLRPFQSSPQLRGGPIPL